MRQTPEQREKSRERILDAVGRGFRKRGFGSAGVDGLAHEAGLTSGAFYAHFPSKSDAFQAAVVVGIRQFRDAVERFQVQEGKLWFAALVDYYLGQAHIRDLAGSCALASLTPEVVHAEDPQVKSAFEAELLLLVRTFAGGLPGPAEQHQEKAWALLSMLAGGVTMARAVNSPVVSHRIAAAVHASAMALYDSLELDRP